MEGTKAGFTEEHQLHKWQQNSWIQFPDSPGMAEASDAASAFTQIIALAAERMPEGVDKKTARPSEDRRNRMKNQWFLLWRNLHGHPFIGLLWEGKARRSTSHANLGGGANVEVSSRPPNVTTVLVCICGRHRDGWKDRTRGTYVDKSVRRNRPGGSDFLAVSSVLGLHPERRRS